MDPVEGKAVNSAICHGFPAQHPPTRIWLVAPTNMMRGAWTIRVLGVDAVQAISRGGAPMVATIGRQAVFASAGAPLPTISAGWAAVFFGASSTTTVAVSASLPSVVFATT